MFRLVEYYRGEAHTLMRGATNDIEEANWCACSKMLFAIDKYLKYRCPMKIDVRVMFIDEESMVSFFEMCTKGLCAD